MTTPDLTLSGLHHVTAITADAQENINFYCGVLGLRLVKLTVNFDDPGSYHLYYGDELGRPGSVMTFFAWPGAFRGRVGPPQVSATAFAVSVGAMDYWSSRLQSHQVKFLATADRFGERVLSFTDPDGLHLEIIGAAHPAGHPWAAGPIPADSAIRGFHSVTLSQEGYEKTAHLLTETMGFSAVGHEQNRFRYRAGTGAAAAGSAENGFATLVDLLCVPDARHGSMGAGVVHHVAFRTPDDARQLTWHQRLIAAGLNVSPVMDRTYFHSIYYREPGGILFEIATETPGFTADQPADQLGMKLMLPPWLETHRGEIEQILPSVRLPAQL
jgi:catechol 2,3-dioxygenase-like lactoylglutathione lyase family enzyme